MSPGHRGLDIPAQPVPRGMVLVMFPGQTRAPAALQAAAIIQHQAMDIPPVRSAGPLLAEPLLTSAAVAATRAVAAVVVASLIPAAAVVAPQRVITKPVSDYFWSRFAS